MPDTFRLWQIIQSSKYAREIRKYFGYEATRTSRSTRWIWGYHSGEWEEFRRNSILAFRILTKEVVRSSETSGNLHWIIYRHISYHSTISCDLYENFKSSVFNFRSFHSFVPYSLYFVSYVFFSLFLSYLHFCYRYFLSIPFLFYFSTSPLPSIFSAYICFKMLPLF
jgi:hypothetical protein